jgi:hypothetical protein
LGVHKKPLPPKVSYINGFGAKLKSQNADITYSQKEGFGMTIRVSSALANASFSYTQNGGLSSTFGVNQGAFGGQGGAVYGDGPNITSMAGLEGAVDSQSAAIAKENLDNKQKDLLKDKLGVSDEEAQKLMSDPEAMKAALKISGFVDDADGSDSNTCAGCSRDGDGFGSKLLNGLEDFGRGLIGQTSTDDGFVDSEGTYHQRTCFTKKTKVKIVNGFKNIEDIRVGDMVLSRNEKSDSSGEIHYSRVTEIFTKYTNLLYIITFEDETHLETTWNHPFWIEGKGWVETKDLKSGDLTVLSDGKSLTIRAVEEKPLDKEVIVYNFEVENDHTYFVADKTATADQANFVWVHNQVATGNYSNGALSDYQNLANCFVGNDQCNQSKQAEVEKTMATGATKGYGGAMTLISGAIAVTTAIVAGPGVLVTAAQYGASMLEAHAPGLASLFGLGGAGGKAANEAVKEGEAAAAETVGAEAANLIPEGNLANHIFSGKAGKLIDTPTNRELIREVSNNPANLVGVDKYGKSWYSQILPNGTQIYSYTQNGVVKGAGINQTPIEIVTKNMD